MAHIAILSRITSSLSPILLNSIFGASTTLVLSHTTTIIKKSVILGIPKVMHTHRRKAITLSLSPICTYLHSPWSVSTTFVSSHTATKCRPLLGNPKALPSSTFIVVKNYICLGSSYLHCKHSIRTSTKK